MTEKESNKWFPMWTDKWLFGSTRIELEPAERSVWIDLLALGSKDNGYIRANEATPYLLSQLAGLLVIPEELLNSTIQKCIQTDKLIQLENGTFYIKNWGEFQLSGRQKARIVAHAREENGLPKRKKGRPKEGEMSLKNDAMSKKIALNREENRIEEKIIYKNICDFIFEKYKEIFKGVYEPRKLTDKIRRKIEARLKEFSEDDIVIALKRIREDKFVTGSNPSNKVYCTPEYCFRSYEMIEKWLNQKSKSFDERCDAALKQGGING